MTAHHLKRASSRAIGVVMLGLILSLAACGGGEAGGNGSANKSPIKVGLAVGLTGYLASNDTPLVQGAKLAAKKINDNGGIDGHPLELHVQDMASNAAKGVTVTNQLLNQDQVSVMINGFTSAATAAEQPINAAHKVPMIVASVLPKDTTWVFSTIPPSQYAAQSQASAAQTLFNAKTVGILYSQTPYGHLTAGFLEDAIKAQGLTLAASEAVDTAATDITPQLTRLKDKHVDAIIDVLTGPVHLVLAKNAAAMGMTTPVIMGIDNRSVFKSATQTYPHTYFVAVPPQVYPNISDAALKSANADFVTAFGEANAGRSYASRGWDAINLLAEALKQTKGQTGEALRDALESMQPYQGATAVYDFTSSDHYGMAKNPNLICRYDGDQIKVVYPTGA
ncbi:MAG TPA: ABC transporter substrate-binding protein [Ktedonobacterales bacterium]|nr:ABC transporter substrate-binding protein [Ktedonobacterales bacterium]